MNTPAFTSQRRWICAPRAALRCAACIACWLFAQLPAARVVAEDATAVAGQTVVDVQVQGHQDVPLNKIAQQIRTRPGRAFDPKQVEEDVQRLNRSRLFVDVRARFQQTPTGVVIVYQVIERRTIRHIRFEGREKVWFEKTLLNQVNIKVGDPLDPFSVEEGRKKLEEFYRERGHNKVRVTLLEGDQPGDRGVTFLVHEGPRQKVRNTEFIGNTIASDARLKTQITSKPPKFWVWKGFVNRDNLEADIDKLTAYYRALGYFQARIGREVDWNKKSDRADVTFVINEGPRFIVRDVRFMGNSKFATEQLAKDLKLERGQFFDQAKMDKDVSSIQDVYGARGYVFADVRAEPRFLDDPGQLDLVYKLEEGARYRVGQVRVHIGGENPHTRQTTVLNRLTIRPGDIADIREIRASERRLKASAIFQNNPALGSAPKIVFSLPEGEEDNEQAVAERPNSKVRGQSPDASPHVAQKPAGLKPTGASSEQAVDIEIFVPKNYQFDEPETVAPPAPEHSTGASTAPASAKARWRQPGAEAMRPLDPRTWTWTESIRDVAPDISDRVSAARQVPGGFPLRRQVSKPAAAPAAAGEKYIFRGQDPGGWNVAGRQTTPATRQPWRPSSETRVAQAPRGPAPVGAVAPAPFADAPYSPPNGFGNPPSPLGAPPAVGSPPALQSQPPAGGGYANPNELFPEGGYVNNPNIEPLPELPFDVYVDETQTGRLMMGVGVNSNAGVVGNFVLDEQNFDLRRFPRSWSEIRNGTAFRGAGQQFRLEAVPGTQFQRYGITFREPYLFNTPISFGVNGYFFNRAYRDWAEQRVGGTITGGYQIRPDLAGVWALRAEDVKVSNPSNPAVTQLAAVLGHNDFYSSRWSLIQDTRDSAFLPTEGHRIEAAFEQAFGKFTFPRGDFDASKYFTLRQRPDGSGRHVLRVGGTVGIAGSNTPLFEHYFVGGFSTIRGFRFRGAGPIDGGVFVGGRFQLLQTVEYMFPITADDVLRAVVFCDAGTVEQDIRVNGNYRVAPGFGLRVSIPALGPAPIALDFAFPVNRGPGDQVQNFSFFIGVTR